MKIRLSRRRLANISLVALAVGCEVSTSNGRLLAAAESVDHLTTQAHIRLVTRADFTPTYRGEIDPTILAQVKALDEMDNTLPSLVSRYSAATSDAESARLRDQILRRLEQIERQYAAVVSSVRGDVTHRSVAYTLLPLSMEIEQIREELSAP